MNKNFTLICAAAASLLVTAAQAAVLTLSPATIAAQPGQTAGWGFSLLNDDAANFLIVTGTEFFPGVASAFGSYDDLLGPRGFIVLAPLATLAENFNGLGAGIGQLNFAASASGRLDGEVRLHYALASVDPNGGLFDPDPHIVNFDATAFAQASALAVPEPSTWAMFGAAGLLAFARRRQLSSRLTA